MTETTSEKEKKRPRPLDLKHSNHIPGEATIDMKECAIKCASPGLPPLSATMRTTVMISKSIEAQQRQIIAQRIATTPGGSEVSHDDDSESHTSTTNTPSTSGMTDGMDNLSIPMSANSNKRLKRNKVPTPLNLGLTGSAPRPLIKSAPIYNVRPQYFTPMTATRSHMKKSGMPPQRVPTASHAPGPHGVPLVRQQRIIMTPMTSQESSMRQIPNTAYPYHIPHSFGRGAPVVPKTATTLRNPASYRTGPPLTHSQLARYQQQVAYQQLQWAKFKQYQESQKVNHVTDVFEGEGTRFAPLEAQPLSSQRSFFDLDSASIKPHAISSGKNMNKERISEESEADDNEDNDDPESAAIEDGAEAGAGIQPTSRVDGAIKLGNDLFKFELDRQGDNDKQRFLNHCAAAWDQFTKIP